MLRGLVTHSIQQSLYPSQLIGLVKADLLHSFLIHAARITMRFIARDSKHTGSDSDNGHHYSCQS